MKLQCLIVDDDPECRKSISQFIEAIDFLELTASTDSPAEASWFIKNKLIDIIFLDIDMLKLCGTEFLAYANSACIFITIAGVEYVVEAFTQEILEFLVKIDVLDYFVKPVSFEVFLKGCNMAKDSHSKLPRQDAQSPDDRFFALCDNLIDKIFYNDLRYAEAMHNAYIRRNNVKSNTA
jgi:response regulator of citrate/malate metabolism